MHFSFSNGSVVLLFCIPRRVSFPLYSIASIDIKIIMDGVKVV